MAFLTFQFFLVEMLYMRGPMSIGLRPFNHGAFQKGVFSPLPNVMVVDA
jgi:hypothetical protein